MLAEALWLAMITLAVGLATTLFGILVYLRHPRTKAVKAFLLVTVMFFAGAVGNFALIVSPDQESALLAGRSELVCLTLLYSAMLYLSSLLPIESPSGWFAGKAGWLAVVTLVSAAVAWFAVQSVGRDALGWTISPTPATMGWVAMASAYVFVAVFLMMRVCLASHDRSIRSQLTAMSIAVAFPLLYTSSIGIIEFAGADVPHIMSFGFLVTLAMFVYGVRRASLFEPLPRRQAASPPSDVSQANRFPKAEFLLYEGKSSGQAYGRFLAEIGPGRDGLIISRTYPERLKELYPIGEIPVIWLATHPGPGRLDPSNLSILQHTIAEFLRRGSDAVVMVDGLEYLVANNPMERVLRALYSVKDEVIMSNSKLFVPFDPQALEQQQLALIEREFEVVRAEEGAGTGI